MRGKSNGTSPNKLALYQRAQEAIEVLMDMNGHTTLTKTEFAIIMATRFGREWLRGDGTGNRHLVEEVCNLTRDQEDDPYAKALFSGFVVSYAPNVGGMTLFDPSGDLSYGHLLHMLAGDLNRQQATKTINRRRLSYWNSGGHQALNSQEPDLARVMFQIEHEIEATGTASDGLVAEFIRLLGPRGSTGETVDA